MKAIYIEWVDSATRKGWSEADGGEPTLCKSIGIDVGLLWTRVSRQLGICAWQDAAFRLHPMGMHMCRITARSTTGCSRTGTFTTWSGHATSSKLCIG